MNTEFEQMQTRLERLENTNTILQSRIITCELGAQHERRKLRVQAGLAFAALLVSVFAFPANRAAIAQGYGVTLATLNTRLIAVEAKTQYMSADSTAKSTTFSGSNLIVNDGGGSTSAIITNAAGDGLGNLIIGYNATGARNGSDIRTGSHNLILGDSQNYSSYGGFTAGVFNTIIAPYASVSGGAGNTVSGNLASISGGSNNTVSGEYASISGGFNGIVSGSYSSISGGYGNTVHSDFTSISGGENITQSNGFGWSGGSYHSP